jgi:MOSC domain-containing protein YiiM
MLLSVNLATETIYTPYDTGRTGIAKQQVSEPVAVSDPGPKRKGHPHPNGLAGDHVCTTEHHGGTDQAVYAYAREDLDWWERELGYELESGRFGENLTTLGLDLTGAVVGERWRIGEVVLQATLPRFPCATFAHRMGEPKWVKRFTARGATGTYLRVVAPGSIKTGDPIEVIRRPAHGVTVGQSFRALTTESQLLPSLLDAGDDLPQLTRDIVTRRTSAPVLSGVPHGDHGRGDRHRAGHHRGPWQPGGLSDERPADRARECRHRLARHEGRADAAEHLVRIRALNHGQRHHLAQRAQQSDGHRGRQRHPERR